MHLARWTAVGAALAVTLAAGSPASAVALASDTFHQDHRATPKLQFEPAWQAPAGLTGEALALEFLKAHAADYALPSDLASLYLEETQESLVGTHYRFQQQIAGIDVQRGEVIVSVAKTDGRIYRVHNNTHPSKNESILPRAASVSEETAYDLAWNRLRAHGEILSPPRARLEWVPVGDSFEMRWFVNLALSAPYGGWEVEIDAQTGREISTRDANIYRVKDAFTEAPLSERIDSWTGALADRRAAFAALEAKEQRREAGSAGAVLASGTGNMFDPDPRATLQDDTLQNGSPAGAFTAAYFTRTLLDISLNAGTYSLTGPWCDIVNWDPPSTAPSTTVTGAWTANRGPNSFNDAMTYYMIDTSERYMQSLGFTGATGIQEGPIDTDTDGANGADNSYYQPGANRMAFGHGCVDDSEDADVMLHEYGHGINHDINPSWGGGDMGAIGEGFGDYWAGSYSYSTPNGPVYHPEWVFSWDGHGSGNQCWPGRVLNAFAAQYVHTTFYGAHQGIPGGFQSDELWSTPCFQSLLEIVNQGGTREESDTIFLESQFGLGGSLKMRDMANAAIQTAGLLYPAGPHSDILIQKFLAHNIVDIPIVLLAIVDDATIVSGGPNNAADPGETVTFKLDVTNEGTLGATNVSAALSSSTPGVVINQGSSAYPDLPAGVGASNTTDYSITVPSGHTCGDPIALSLLVDYDDGAPQQTTVGGSMGTGVAQGASQSVSPSLAIPDNNPTGVTSNMVVSGTGASVTSNLNVDLDITHTWIGDLIVTLQSPGGTQVILHNRTGGSADNIIGNYPGTLTPDQSLSAMIGDPLDGTWKMIVSDHAGQDLGTLNSWGINDVSGFVCDTAVDVTIGSGKPVTFALESASPNPFASTTNIRFAVPGQGARLTLKIFDVAGRHVRTLSDGFVPAGTHAATWNGRTEGGERVGSGIYFYRLESEDFRSTKKVIRLN